MPHEIVGYVVNKETSAPLANVPVRVVTDDSAETLIPVGGEYGGSENPMMTDANGLFSWTCELSPGPVKTVAQFTGSEEAQIRSGRELMQSGVFFTSSIPVVIQALSTGVVRGIAEDFLVEAMTGQRKVRVNTGAALLAGVLFSLDADREITIDPNPSLNTRKDYVVLNQYVGSPQIGRQFISIVKGVTNDTLADLNTDPTILQVPLAYVTIPQNATSVTVTDLRQYVGPTALPDDIVTIASLSDEVLALFEDSVGVGKYTGEKNFLGSSDQTVSSSAPGPFTLATATVKVPAGRWLLDVSAIIHNCRCTVSSGIVRFRLTGTGAPTAPDDTTRPIRFSGNVFRGAGPVTSRLVVNPTAETTYTVNLTAQYESGDPVVLSGGNLSINAI